MRTERVSHIGWTVLCVLLLSGGWGRAQQPPTGPAPPTVPAGVKTWTVLIYMSGDDFPGLAPLEDASIDDFNEMEQVGSGPEVNIVVQWDRGTFSDVLDTAYGGDPTQSWESTRRYYVVQDPNQIVPTGGQPSPFANRIYSPMLDDLGELNMGDEETLVDFVKWGISRFPAEHYFVIIWNHGGGWKPRARFPHRGIVFDASVTGNAADVDPSVYLTNRELKSAFSRLKQFLGRNIDILGLDASGMGLLEVAYQVRYSVDYLISSLLFEPADGYPYDVFLQDLTDNPRQPIPLFLENFVASYVASYQVGQPTIGAGSSVTQGVYDMSRVTSLADAVDNLARLLLENLRLWLDEITIARSQSQSGSRLSVPTDGDPDNLDIFDLARNLQAQIDDPALDQAAQAVMDAVEGINGAIIAEGHLSGVGPLDTNVDNSHGTAIYFPPNTSSYDRTYQQVLDFAADTQWDEFLVAYTNQFSDTLGPIARIIYPLNGATIHNARPTIVATIVDQGGGRVDPATIELRIDGRLIDPHEFTFSLETGTLEYTPPVELAATGHTVQVQAQDLAGNKGSAATITFRIAPPVLGQGLRLFSVPLELSNPDPMTIFGTPDFRIARWVPTDVNEDKYHYYPDPYASFLPPDTQGSQPIVSAPPAGLGYWIWLPQETPLLFGAGKPVSAPQGYRIHLWPGWNLVGTPFNEFIGWGSVQFYRANLRLNLKQAVQRGWTNGILYSYVPNLSNPDLPGYYDFGDVGEGVLEPFGGYWVLALEETDLIIYSSAEPVGGQELGVTRREPRRLAPSRSPSSPPAETWQVQLSATAGPLLDPCNFFGQARGAEVGYDEQDVLEPPGLPGSLNLSFLLPAAGRSKGRWAKDMRPLGRGAETWEFEVYSPEEGEVTLTWSNLARVPAKYQLLLFDRQARRKVCLRTCAAYTYHAAKGETRGFSLQAVPRGLGPSLHLLELSVRVGRGGCQVVYTLSREAQVQVRVLSRQGREIWRVNGGRKGPGRQVQIWEGRDHQGRPVPNGYYLVEVTATTPEAEVRRAVRGFVWMR